MKIKGGREWERDTGRDRETETERGTEGGTEGGRSPQGHLAQTGLGLPMATWRQSASTRSGGHLAGHPEGRLTVWGPQSTPSAPRCFLSVRLSDTTKATGAGPRPSQPRWSSATQGVCTARGGAVTHAVGAVICGRTVSPSKTGGGLRAPGAITDIGLHVWGWAPLGMSP